MIAEDEDPEDPKEAPPRRSRGDGRAQILKAARRLLAARGFEGMTLQAVADEVGIRKPSVLHHFPSKAALRDGVIEEILEHWGQLLPQMLRNATGPTNRFENLMRELIGFFTEDPDRARLLIRENLDRPLEYRQIFREHVQPWLVMIGNNVRDGQEQGTYRADVDPEEYVLQVIQLILVCIATGDLLTAPSRGGARKPFERRISELMHFARCRLFANDSPVAGATSRKRKSGS